MEWRPKSFIWKLCLQTVLLSNNVAAIAKLCTPLLWSLVITGGNHHILGLCQDGRSWPTNIQWTEVSDCFFNDQYGASVFSLLRKLWARKGALWIWSLLLLFNTMFECFRWSNWIFSLNIAKMHVHAPGMAPLLSTLLANLRSPQHNLGVYILSIWWLSQWFFAVPTYHTWGMMPCAHWPQRLISFKHGGSLWWGRGLWARGRGEAQKFSDHWVKYEKASQEILISPVDVPSWEPQVMIWKNNGGEMFTKAVFDCGLPHPLSFFQSRPQ